jgi:PAP2 superfamily
MQEEPTEREVTPMPQDARLSPIEESLDRFTKRLLLFFLLVTAGIFFLLRSRGINFDLSLYFRVNGFNRQNSSALASLFVLYLLCRPARRHLAVTLGAGLLAEIVYSTLSLPVDVGLWKRLTGAGAGLGLAGFLGCVWLWLRAGSENAKSRARISIMLALCLFFFPEISGKTINLLSAFTPKVFDSHAYVLEGSLGIFPSQVVARFLGGNPWLDSLFLAIYARLTVFVLVGLWLNLLYEERTYTNTFIAFVAGGFLAFPFYFLLPMVGIGLFAGIPPWPLEPLPSLETFPVVPAPGIYPRTCIPSLHTAWVLVAFFAVCRISRRIAAVYATIAILTIISAMGPAIGHYFLDVLVGVPFAVVLVAIATRETPSNKRVRRYCLFLNFGLVTLSIVLLRFVPGLLADNPTLSWIFFWILVPVAFWSESKLACRSMPPRTTS